MPTENDKNKDLIFVERWREFMNWPTSGSHRLDGILFARGPSIQKGVRVEGACIQDLLPTWLSLLEQDIPENLEGKVLHSLFEKSGESIGKDAVKK